MESGNLPRPRAGLSAAVVDNAIYVTGGFGDDDDHDLMSILSWNSTAESWRREIWFDLGRFSHAAVAVPRSMIECSGCSFVCFHHLLIIALLYIACQQFLQIVKAELNAPNYVLIFISMSDNLMHAFLVF